MTAKTKKTKRSSGRSGRPSKEASGEVEARILDAAERLFLSKGFQTTSMDEVAEEAPASKPTIYSYFPGKEALFAAVVGRMVAGLSDFAAFTPAGHSFEDRLTSIGVAVVERAMDEWVGILRATIAEAERFPNLSHRVHEASRNAGTGLLSHLLNDAAQLSTQKSKAPFSPERRIPTAKIFMDLVLLPMLMRAMMGDEAKDIRRELPAFVRERVAFFLAACDRGWTH